MAISRAAREAEKRADRLQRQERRREAEGEIIEARMRFATGFGVTFIATQIVPRVVPSIAQYQTYIDLGLAAAGTYFGVTDSGPFGDYAVGAAAVGATQTLDNVSNAIADFFNAA